MQHIRKIALKLSEALHLPLSVTYAIFLSIEKNRKSSPRAKHYGRIRPASEILTKFGH